MFLDVYKQRNAIVRSMGFQTYGEYLGSELWRSIRRRVMGRDNHLCRCCYRNPATQVHHKDYDGPTMRGERLGSLMAVCHPCHEKAEFDGDRKRPLRKVNKLLTTQQTPRAKAGKKHRRRRKPRKAEIPQAMTPEQAKEMYRRKARGMT